MSYSALVARVDNILQHPNADRLEILMVHGHQIIAGLGDFKVGDLGLLFVEDGQLSQEYSDANNCVGTNDPITGKKMGGYFGRNRRVRGQKLRGEMSNGYFAPLSSLAFTGGDINSLTEGTQLSELNGITICNKYFTPATLNAMKGGTPKTRKENKCFAKHVDTTQLKFINDFPKNSILYISEKIHGTSSRVGYVPELIEPQKRFWHRLVPFYKPSGRVEYQEIYGTRNVIIQEGHEGFHGNDDWRFQASSKLQGKLHKGEVIYGEIVGYANGVPIMGDQDTTKLKDKKIQQEYGNLMRYKYGCQPNECKLFIYRITRVNEDGIAEDLSWPRIKARCWELEIDHVPEIGWDPIVWGAGYQGNFNMFREMVEKELDGSSSLDPTHIREGVVIRVESEYGVDFFKAKSFLFGILEGYLKDDLESIDLEEVS